MDAIQGLADGFGTALSVQNLLWVFVGVAAGTVVGILPGLGPPATIALLLPLTVDLDPATGLIFLAGIYYGAKYGGSTTAILLNIPGESASVATLIDGHEMAKQGRAGAALGIAAIGSFVAGTVGVIGLTFLAPVVADLAVEFGPPEYFALISLGLASVMLLAGESLLKGFISAALGLLLATVGGDIISGTARFTGGQVELLDGIEFIALSVGIFALGEVLVNLEEASGVQVFKSPSKLRELLPSRQDLKDSRMAIAQGSVLGFIVGALPGAGSTVASFLSYSAQKRLSPHPERLGKGAIDGVAAPESANNSETGGSMIPLLSLGIPGSGTTAILLGALVLYGLQPGPLLFTESPDIVWPIIASMFIGNVALLILNLPLVPVFASVLRLPYWVLYPGIIVISIVGVYSVNQSMFDVWMLLAFGLVGYVMRKLDVPAAPLVLAFVLGPLFERALRQTMVLSDGSPTIFLDRPLSLVFLALAALTLASPLLAVGRRLRREGIEDES